MGEIMKDYLGKNCDNLLSKKLVLLDMDGTIYLENSLFDGVTQYLDNIKNSGGRYVFITNNPTKSSRDYRLKLEKMGITDLTDDNFYTSVQASIALFLEKFGNKLIYAQGTKSFITQLKEGGLNVTEEFNPDICAVLVAFDTELTAEKLRTTCKTLTLCDVPYYATNPDWVCPVEFGYIPDCGSMCVGIKYATGKEPIFIGKPLPTMVQTVMKKFNVNQEDTVVIGDRLYTDIACGNNAGVDTVCVLSGEATMQDIQESEVKPTYVLQSIKDLV